MSKKKGSKRRVTPKSPPPPAQVSVASVQMSTEDLQHMIANAIVEAEGIKAKRAADKKAEELAEWRKAIGYDESKTGIAKLSNRFTGDFRILFVPRKHIKGTRVSNILIQEILRCCFVSLQWITALFSLLLIAAIPLSMISPNIHQMNGAQIAFSIVLALGLFIVSRVFRIAGVEIDNIKDRNNLYGLFAAITSIISIVIAIIAIVKGK